MMKGEISTSMMIAIIIAVMVLLVVVAVIVRNIGEGGNDLALEQCRLTNDIDCDGTVDKLDPTPCGSPEVGKSCPEWAQCVPGSCSK